MKNKKAPLKEEQHKKEAMTIRTPEDIKSKLEKEAFQKGLSINSLLCLILTDFIRKENQHQ